jgi:hypothetical protein
MAQPRLSRVLDAIKSLPPDELRVVQHVVGEQLIRSAADDPDELVLQSMLSTGIITEIKRPDRKPKPARRLITLQGKPFSETIIEERR